LEGQDGWWWWWWWWWWSSSSSLLIKNRKTSTSRASTDTDIHAGFGHGSLLLYSITLWMSIFCNPRCKKRKQLTCHSFFFTVYFPHSSDQFCCLTFLCLPTRNHMFCCKVGPH
jgi:hypothetical protein